MRRIQKGMAPDRSSCGVRFYCSLKADIRGACGPARVVLREPVPRGLRSWGPRSPLARRRLPPLLALQRPHQRLGVFLQPARALRYRRGRRGHLGPVEPMPQALVNGVRETARPAGVTGASPQVLVTDVERNLSRHMVSIPHLYASRTNVHAGRAENGMPGGSRRRPCRYARGMAAALVCRISAAQ
jgi:hypothetical protein